MQEKSPEPKVNVRKTTSNLTNSSLETKKKTILAFDSNLKFKVVLVGDSNVGKTSVFLRYIDEIFEDEGGEEKQVDKIKTYY